MERIKKQFSEMDLMPIFEGGFVFQSYSLDELSEKLNSYK